MIQDNFKKIVCVAGASGLVGSHLVKEGLRRGYCVRGTLRDCSDPYKVSYLKKLDGAEDRLELFSADMNNHEAYLNILKNVDCVFIACLIPVFYGPTGKPAKEMNDEQGYKEIINPTVDGCINILRAAAQNNVKNIVICSSTSSTNPNPPVAIKSELHWSDENDQCKLKKYTSAAKTVMEKAAIKFAKENGMRLSIILPTGLYGPVILPSHMDGNPHSWIKRLLTGGEGRHKKIPNDSTSLIHLYDLASLFFTAYENTESSGRYFGVFDSWHWRDLYSELKKNIPDMKMPESFSDEPVMPTKFDFSRRDSLGVSIRDIKTCVQETVEWIQSQK